jgi:hypothetical protein
MATMGRGKVSVKNRPVPPEVPAVGIAIPAVNLGVVPTTIYPVTTLDVPPSVVGGPIMREDFITRTGFMPPRVVD